MFLVKLYGNGFLILIDCISLEVRNHAVNLQVGDEFVADFLEGEFFGFDKIVDEVNACLILDYSHLKVIVNIIGRVLHLNEVFVHEKLFSVGIFHLIISSGRDFIGDKDLRSNRRCGRHGSFPRNQRKGHCGNSRLDS